MSPVHTGSYFVWDQDKWRNMTVANSLLPPSVGGEKVGGAWGEDIESETDSAGPGARRQAQ